MEKKLPIVWAFVLWFSVSLVGTFFVITTFGNPFIKSVIIALVVSFLIVKDKN